jgi:hypothetical protein
MGFVYRIKSASGFYLEASFDDTIVSHAQQTKAAIMTNNRKLFKYQNREFRIFEKYELIDEKWYYIGSFEKF